MKKILSILVLCIMLLFVVSGCTNNSDNNKEVNDSNPITINGDDVGGSTSAVEIADDEISGAFVLLDSNKEQVEGVNNVYTITVAGTYKATGKLEEGQIYVNCPEGEVEISLEGVSISNSNVSPIFVLDCEEVTLKIKKDTLNYIYDNRNTDYSESEDDTIGKGAIYANNGDLKFSGKGTLSVTSLKNSGIHGKDNVSIKNITLLVKAANNGIKGNDKVKIEENPTIGIVCGNNGIRTSNSDKGSKAQHGYIYIYGGTITINSYGDGIDAEYAVEIAESTDDEGNTYTPVIDIYTNIYSSFTMENTTTTTTTANNVKSLGRRPGGGFDGGGFSGQANQEKADDSAKGIKANEYINISGGEIFINSYDDGLHTNNDVLETGLTASANINISGGTIKLKVSDDGIHADGNLNVDGGMIYISTSYEGLEANIITINDGDIYVYATDDGINSKNELIVNGGRVDVTVSPNGDRDGIDSNGTININGGIVITRGPNQQMAAPLDAEYGIKVSGGVLIIIGYNPRLTSSLKTSQSSNGLTKGDHVVTINDTEISYNNVTNYSGKVTVYASSSATIK